MNIYIKHSAKILLCTLLVNMAHAQTKEVAAETKLPSEWIAGANISEHSIEKYGVESYFVALPISDDIFSRIDGLSYKENCTVPLDELRYIRLLHYNANGQITMGEMICNKKIREDILYIFRGLFDAKYPIERIRLVDEYEANDTLSMINNNTSAFNFRFISGTNRLSKHSLGLAVDINPLYNPYVKKSDNSVIVEPAEGQEYADRDREFQYKIDTNDLCYKLFTERGFIWGGNWHSVKDYQHFEK